MGLYMWTETLQNFQVKQKRQVITINVLSAATCNKLHVHGKKNKEEKQEDIVCMYIKIVMNFIAMGYKYWQSINL